MTTVSLTQIINEIKQLQLLLDALKGQSWPFLTPVQAARFIQHALGMQQQLVADSGPQGPALAQQIEVLLEHAYEMMGTAEIRA